MRIIVCGDSHIGAVFGLGRSKKDGGNTRIDDYKKTLDSIINYTIESGADVFVQTGDIFDSRNPSPENMSIVNNAFKKLSKNNITSIVIMGNHDYRKSGKGFTSSISSLSAKDLPNVRVVLDPQIVRVSNDNNESTNLLLLPYRDKRMYSGDTLEERCGKYNAHIESLIKSCTDEDPIVTIGHNFFYEGSYNDYGGAELLIGKDSLDGCSLSIMGHQHNFRVVREGEHPIIYIGSMEKLNFGDQNVDKFFIDYNTLDKKVLIKKIKTRELCDARINLDDCDVSNISEEAIGKIEGLDLKDKVARIRVAVPEAMVSAVNSSYIEKKAYELGAFYVSKVVVEAVSKRFVRDTSILKHKDDFSIFKAFVEAQSFADNERSLILKKSKEIMG